MTLLRDCTRRTAGGALLLASVFAGRTGAAQTINGADGRHGYESPQNFLVELRAGGYYPNIDRTVGTASPYANFFGNGLRIQAALEFDWQIVRVGPVFSLGLGASLGYTQANAQAPYATATINPDPNSWGSRSATSSTLHVLPTTVVAVARFDGLARRFRYFPIVPYVKAGFAYSFWFVMNTDGIAHASNGAGAYGGSLGWHGALGLALLLDVFEPGVARRWDSNAGINHSYLFAELHYTDLSGSTRTQLDVGALAWSLGIALEF